MTYTTEERRKHQRICARFMVSYRILGDDCSLHTTQTKNISLGGMMITTNKRFDPGVKLALEICLPFDPNPIMAIAQVLGSQEITKDLIYDTRLLFLAVDERHKKAMSTSIEYYLKKGEVTNPVLPNKNA